MDSISMSKYLHCQYFFQICEVEMEMLLVDAKMIMTNPTKDRCPRLMDFGID